MKSVNYHCGANIRQFALAAIFALIMLAWGAVAQAAPNQQTAPATVGTTFSVSSSACSGPGTLHQAIEDANNNPGHDTINFLLGVDRIDVCKVDLSALYWTKIKESVDIIGNGVTLNGGQRIYTDDGKINPLICPSSTAGVSVAKAAPGLLEIGTLAGGGSGITVNITGVKVKEVPYLFRIRAGASLTVEDSSFTDIHNYERQCSRSAIVTDAQASFTLRNSRIDSAWIDDSPSNPLLSSALINASGPITIENSIVTLAESGFAVRNDAGNTTIVSSQFQNAGGFQNGSGTMKIVNSAWHSDIVTGEDKSYYQFQQVGANGTMLLEATSVSVGAPYCRVATGFGKCTDLAGNPTGAPVMPFNVAAGALELRATAIGGPDFPDASNVIYKAPGATVTADANTWIQPRPGQDADALKSVTGQPALLTAPDGLPTDPFAVYPDPVIPMLGTSANPGKLLDVISNSECSSGANELINPIDGFCIDKDVLGNRRWDGNNKRNIGAVQLELAPQLYVAGTGDGTVDLGWSRPLDPQSGAITGYVLSYREAGTTTWTRIDITGPDNRAHQVTGLTNGTKYEFEVVAVNNVGDGPLSNRKSATPYGPVDPPVVTATPGNTEVTLTWPQPNSGGHPIVGYQVFYRPVNQTNGTWTVFEETTSLTVPGLTNGTEYEFGVATVTAAGTSDLGKAKATPLGLGVVVIEKRTAPAGGTGFGFDGSLGSFTLDDNGSKTIADVQPGAYTVSEDDPTGLGYDLTGLTCVDSDPNGTPSTGDLTSRTASINVELGETVTCTFTNTEEDIIVIEKRTIPPGGSSFVFNDNIGPLASFSLADTQTRIFSQVKPGDYQVIEVVAPGYDLTAIDCLVDGVSVPGDLTTATANISLKQPGGNAHCTFTNTARGQLRINKTTLPTGVSQTFDFQLSGPDAQPGFSLADGGQKIIPELRPGAWEISEAAAAGFELSNLFCDSNLGTSTYVVDMAQRKATVQLAPGDSVDCTFVNSQDDTITVEKMTNPGGNTTIDFDFSGSGSIGSFALKDGEKKTFAVDPNAGPYTLTESDPSGSGYDVVDIRCTNNQTGAETIGDLTNRSVKLETQPGESQHCIFTNGQHGSVIIRKATVPGGGAGFGFDGSFGSFDLDDGQTKTIADVKPGGYQVFENDPSALGYALTGLRCVDGDTGGIASTGDPATGRATINVDPGETVTCTFTNSQLDTVAITKLTVPAGGTGFDFGQNVDGSGAFALDDGGLKSFTNVAAGDYTVSEDDPTPGYDLDLILCYDAATGQFFNGDVASRKVELKLAAGHQVMCEFVNVQRGTIIIEKAPGSGVGYSFGGSLGDFMLDSGAEQGFSDQVSGQYRVTEATPAGEVLTGLTCTDSDANGIPSTSDAAARTATINLDPGETVRCTFTNAKLAPAVSHLFLPFVSSP